MERKTVIVIGGGPAGFFSAIACAENYPQARVILLEKTRQLLSKVRISGGGRCNVTHSCFEPKELVRSYPRGSNELRGPFSRFQPQDTIQWFESRGVLLKTEEDGRMFPITDSSETIIHCLINEAKRLGVQIETESSVESLIKCEEVFELRLANGNLWQSDAVIIATGSFSRTYPLLRELGHTVIPLVPSLFTFNIPESPLSDLSGLAVNSARVTLPAYKLEQTGPVLVTHWGISGPAVLKLSAWAAREMENANYQTDVVINWLPLVKRGEVLASIMDFKRTGANKLVQTESPFAIPKQLWKRCVNLARMEGELRWSHITTNHLHGLVEQLIAMRLKIDGKTTYKQEFVSAGGINLKEINFKTMESRVCRGLYFAGEVLDIDGITGGFNFQNAWTTGWIAGQLIGRFNQPLPC